MKKMPSLFKRNYATDRLAYDEVTPGCEWVMRGEGVPTEKFDGTCCMVRDGTLYRRYDRKLSKRGRKAGLPAAVESFKPAPDGWEACEDGPDLNTGHWPGWIRVGDEPENKYHREAASMWMYWSDGTYELVGPKVQGNPHQLDQHYLVDHSTFTLGHTFRGAPPRTFDGLRDWLEGANLEGIVWHHPDGRMCKVKRKDFGFPWPHKIRGL